MKLPYLQLILLGLILLAARCFAQAPDYCQSSEVPTYIKWNIPKVFDGPAELPERCVATMPWNMPSPNGVVTVAAGASLQSAYNSAVCGTTLKLASTGVWSGSYNFAAKQCPDTEWITIESDIALPNPGTRMTPAAGAKLATILLKGVQALTFGDHIRFRGIHLAQVPNSGVSYEFINLHGANHIVFEQVYCHGNPGQEAQRCFHLTTSQYVAVIDSWVSDFHCIALTGVCGDAQAVGGGAGAIGDAISKAGPYKFVNNHLEGSAETFEWGGGIADGCPTDITIQRNHMFKPLSWNPSDPTYAGVKYTVKNLFELKNACRVLVEGNVLENVWGGFTQLGYAVLFTPKNQAGANGTNLCPACNVNDVTFRDNYISTAAGAFLIGNGANQNGAWSAGQHRLSIHDNLADNLQYATCYACGLSLMDIGSAYSSTNPPPASEILSDVSFANNTIIAAGDLSAPKQTSQLLNAGGVPVNKLGVPQVSNVSFVNNVAYTLKTGMYSTGGGTDNCMSFAPTPRTPATEWPTCFVGTSPFTGNYLVGPTTLKWPSGNTQSATMGTVPAGVGANMTLVNQYTAGVK